MQTEIEAELRQQRDAYCARATALSIALAASQRLARFAAHSTRCNYYPADWEGDGGVPCSCGLQEAHNELRAAMEQVEIANKSL